jgi:hypothetical protein
MLENVMNVTRLDHPGVATTCIFGTAVDTPAGCCRQSEERFS